MLKGIVSDILDHLFDNKCYEEIRADVIACSQSSSLQKTFIVVNNQ